MKPLRKTWGVQLFTASLALLLLTGCAASEPTGTVSGKVTLDGEPVDGGEIGIISPSGYSAIAKIGSDGSFTIQQEVPVGNYTITVSPPALTEAPGAEGDSAELKETNVPEAYMDESSSDIKKEITEGTNSLTIELKSSGPPVAEGGGEMAP